MVSETVFQLGVDGSADDQFRLFDYKRTDVDRCVYPSAFRNVLLCMGKHGISGTTDTGVVHSMDYGVLGQNLFCLVQLASFPLIHLINLLERQESKHSQTFQDICIIHVSPILIEFKG